MTPLAFISQVSYIQFGKLIEIYILVKLALQIGGLLGLCLGFSFLSLIELVYWCIYRLPRNALDSE